MRGALVWPAVVGVGMFAACVAVVIVSQQQFQHQMAQMRQELDRLEGRHGASDLEPLPPERPSGSRVQVEYTDTRLLRRIFLDDLREQLAGEESEEVASHLIRSWFETPAAGDSKAPAGPRCAAPEGR
jgi:hypothetical protein